jgi:hypothetical protein
VHSQVESLNDDGALKEYEFTVPTSLTNQPVVFAMETYPSRMYASGCVSNSVKFLVKLTSESGTNIFYQYMSPMYINQANKVSSLAAGKYFMEVTADYS